MWQRFTKQWRRPERRAEEWRLGFLPMSAIGLHNGDLIMTLTLFAGTANGILLAVYQHRHALSQIC
jgi:NitT/TauT family transport system permease protein